MSLRIASVLPLDSRRSIRDSPRPATTYEEDGIRRLRRQGRVDVGFARSRASLDKRRGTPEPTRWCQEAFTLVFHAVELRIKGSTLGWLSKIR